MVKSKFVINGCEGKFMAKKYVVLEEEKDYACCNLVLWDFLIVMLIVFFALGELSFEIHTVFKLIISLVGGLLFLTLMRIKYLKNILTVVLSAIWALGITAALSEHEKINGDWIWIITIGIISFLICYGLHVWGSQSLGLNDEIEVNVPKFDFDINDLNGMKSEGKNVDLNGLKEENDSAIDCVTLIIEKETALMKEMENLQEAGITNRVLNAAYVRNRDKCEKLIPELVSLLENYTSISNKNKRKKLLSNIHKLINEIDTEIGYVNREISNAKASTETKNNIDIDESLFSGCTDMDSLTKRYHMLMKTFHPDNKDGDTEMTRKIQNTYEYMKKKF